MFDLIALYAVLALAFPLAKSALFYGQPIFFAGMCMLLGGSILLIFQLASNGRLLKLDIGQVKLLAAITLFSICGANIFFYWGIQHVSSVKAAFIYNLSPLFAVLFSYLLFNQMMNTKKWIGLLLGFSGFFPIVMSKASGGLGPGVLISWAEISLLLASMSTALGWSVMKKVVRSAILPPALINGLTMFFGSLIILCVSWLFESWNPAPFIFFKPFFLFVLAVTFISNIFGYMASSFLLKKYTATLLLFASSAGSVFAAFYGWLFLHENITWHFFLSAAMVGTGLIIFYREELRQGYIVK